MSFKPNGSSQSGSEGHSAPDDDIRQQLEKILASPEFQNSPMLRDFLRFVVEKTLSGCAQVLLLFCQTPPLSPSQQKLNK
jgi:hypothetical protein